MNDLMLIRTEDLLHNPTNRVPIALCLDVSGSMLEIVGGEVQDLGYNYQQDGRTYRAVSGGVTKIGELNQGVRLFFDALKADPIANASAEIAIVTFSDAAQLNVDFQGLDRLGQPPTLMACGATDLGGGVNLALDCLETRKREYQCAGIDYFQPWLVLMTDGVPTTASHQQAAPRVCRLEEQGKLVVFPIGIGNGADMSVLRQFSQKKQPLRLPELNFARFFEWLSKSVMRVSQSRPGERVSLDMEGIKGWAEL